MRGRAEEDLLSIREKFLGREQPFERFIVQAARAPTPRGSGRASYIRGGSSSAKTPANAGIRERLAREPLVKKAKSPALRGFQNGRRIGLFEKPSC